MREFTVRTEDVKALGNTTALFAGYIRTRNSVLGPDMTLYDVAKDLNVSVSYTSVQVGKLEAAGYVETKRRYVKVKGSPNIVAIKSLK